jgi:hypothetical protein
LILEFKARYKMLPTVVIDDVQKALDSGGPDANADLELLGTLRQEGVIRLILLASEPVADRIRSTGQPRSTLVTPESAACDGASAWKPSGAAHSAEPARQVKASMITSRTRR